MEIGKLPRNLSELLREAVEDCKRYQRLVDENPKKYHWDFATWIESSEGRCNACMAGAILLNMGHTSEDVIHNGPEELVQRMFAVDDMRIGEFTSAYGRFVESPSYGTARPALVQVEAEFRNHTLRHDHPDDKRDWDVYLKFAEMLEERGL